MYFIVYKPRTKYKKYSNERWATEDEAKDFAKRSTIKYNWKIVEYNIINKNKYWYA